jgi:hypothetical protein
MHRLEVRKKRSGKSQDELSSETDPASSGDPVSLTGANPKSALSFKQHKQKGGEKCIILNSCL